MELLPSYAESANHLMCVHIIDMLPTDYSATDHELIMFSVDQESHQRITALNIVIFVVYCRAFSLLGVNVQSWYEELPKMNKLSAEGTAGAVKVCQGFKVQLQIFSSSHIY